jgi:tetratricopeptide (TPR) repeat protein
MPAKKSLWVGIIGLLACGGGLYAFCYVPPLLREDHLLDPSRLIDQLGFAWHQNKAFWYEAERRDSDARREYLASSWYRPNLLHKYLDTPISKKTLTVDDWMRLGNLYVEAGLYEIASTALAEAVASGASNAKAFENFARAEEKNGETAPALIWYRRALGLDESRFRSLAGLERLGKVSEKQSSRIRLEEMATKILVVEQMTADAGSIAIDGGWNLWTNGALSADARLLAGRKLIRVFARGSVADEQWPIMAFLVEGQEIGRRTVATNQWESFDFPLDLAETDIYHVSIRFLNDFKDKVTGEDRNLYVQKIVFESFPDETEDSRSSTDFSPSSGKCVATVPRSAEFGDQA